MPLRREHIEEYLQGASLTGYKEFGAHLSREYDQDGVRFTVYAPHASKVEIIATFNRWEPWSMKREDNGIWSVFIGGAQIGDMYKYRITTSDGQMNDRMDPFAFYCEKRPNTASIVYDLDGYRWSDEVWMSTRNKNFSSPMNIYEVHAGSWKVKEEEGDQKFFSYTELADQLVPYLVEMGYTHLELMPLTEYPYDGSWGYQVAGYFAPTSRYGEPKELMALIDKCHQAGIGVILDFVPLHFVCDFYALHQYDGSYLYESEQEQRRYSPWGTALFDFTKPHVLSFLKSALDFWISFYHLDGIRYDAVSNLIYNDGDPGKGINDPGVWFLKNCNYAIGHKHPYVMLMAEDSSNHLKVTAPVAYGGLGFDYKWCLGWMHDTFDYLALPPEIRANHREKFLHSLRYFYQDLFILPFSHDEVVHGKKTIIDKLYGNYEQKFDQLRCLYLYMYTHPGKKLVFMGNELAEFKEWDENKGLGWNLRTYPAHDAFWHFMKDLSQFYKTAPALFGEDYNPMGFRWLDQGERYPALFAYERSTLDDRIMVVLNFSDRASTGYLLDIGHPGEFEVVMDTSLPAYGGKGPLPPVLKAKAKGSVLWGLEMDIPPFSGCILKQK